MLLFILPNRREELRAKIQAHIDAYQQAGLPITAMELARFFPQAPTESNSVLAYQNASAAYVTPTSMGDWPFMTPSKFPFRTQSWSQATREEVASAYSTNQAMLDLIHQAALLPSGSYLPTFTNGFITAVGTPISQHVKTRTVAQFLAVVVAWQAQEGRPDRSTDLLVDSLGIPRSLESSPWLVDRMIGVACFGLDCSALELALNKTSFSDDQFRRISIALDAADPAPSLTNQLLVQRCRAVEFRGWYRTELAHPTVFSWKGRIDTLLTRLSGGGERDFLAYLDVLDQYVAAAQMPYPTRLETALKLQAQAAATNMYSSLFPDLGKVIVADARIETTRRMAQTAIALERYRLANNGRLPDNLSSLVPAFLPAVPLDPFTGRQLGYKKLAQGYELHSLGTDAIKGSGVDFPAIEHPASAATSDITFTVERHIGSE